jgi:hypothetical protein
MTLVRAGSGGRWSTAKTEEARTRPMSACDLPSDDGEGRIALAAPLDAVGMDEDHVGDDAPLANQTSS